MLTHPTLDLLHTLGLHGMAKGFSELAAQPESASLEHAEWLTLLLEHEATLRRQKRFETRARAAKLRQSATIEDVDYRSPRGLDRALFLKLTACDWIRDFSATRNSSTSPMSASSLNFTRTPRKLHSLRTLSTSFGAGTSRSQSSAWWLLIFAAWTSTTRGTRCAACHSCVGVSNCVPGAGANTPPRRKSLTAAA